MERHVHKQLRFVKVATLSLIVCFVGLQIPAAWAQADFVPGEIIIRFEEGVLTGEPTVTDGVVVTGIASVDALMQAHGVSGIRKISRHRPTYVLTLPASADVPAVVAAFANDPNIKYAEPNYRVSIDGE